MISKMPQQKVNGYISTVLKLYLHLPETPDKPNVNDRKTAEELQSRGITLATVESALLLAAARRLGRLPDLPTLTPIRSLAYFLPVIQELLDNPIADGYLEYLRIKVRSLSGKRAITKCG
jgi:hypothetical protein